MKLLILLLLLFASATKAEFRNRVDSLAEFSFDTAREIKIDSLIVPIISGKVQLSRGMLYLSGYLDGQPTVAFFMGQGNFLFKAENAIERQQIKRFYHTDTVYVEFDQVYFAFPIQSDIFRHLYNKGEKKKPPYRVRTMLNAIRKIPDKKFKFNLPLHIYRASLENKQNLLWINFLKKRYFHTVYYYDPYSEEQISLYKYTSNFKTPQIVSSLPDKTIVQCPAGIDLFLYNIDVDLSTTGQSSIACQMNMAVQSDSLKIIELNFPANYKIDSVKGDGGDGGDIADSLSWIKEKDRPGLAVELSGFYYVGDTVHLEIFYRTNLFRHYMRYGVVQEHLTHWYPYNGYRQLSEYNIRYQIDDGFDFISVGEKRLDSSFENRRNLEFHAAYPTPYISFNYGLFDSVKIENTTTPITLHYLQSDRPSIFFGGSHIKKVADDIAGSFEYYTNNFGPYPFARLDVAAMAVGFGQGSPGLVHLSQTTFTRSIAGVDDKFRAHEVAHQWWGQLVNPASYHDVWLSEGLAEYSAALYILRAKENKKTFREILKNWRKMIIQRGKINGKMSVGFPAGAIALGYRLGSEMSPGDFEVLNYFKAAYVLHMLRFELESQSGDRTLFLSLLADYAKRFAGQLATTEDFINIARQFLGDRTNRFFDQWLYDWRVPKIKKKSKKHKNGSVDITIIVDKVSDDFETPYPVRFRYEKNNDTTIVYKITKGENRFVFAGDKSLKIKKVIFNPDYDILEQ